MIIKSAKRNRRETKSWQNVTAQRTVTGWMTDMITARIGSFRDESAGTTITPPYANQIQSIDVVIRPMGRTKMAIACRIARIIRNNRGRDSA